MRRWLIGALAVLAILPAGSAQLCAADCTRTDFETAVGTAAGALSALNQKNTPVFQAKLRALKDKRGWSHDQFMAEAAPLVQDDTISEFDRKSGEYLSQINSMSAAGTAGRTPDCKLLGELRANMQAMVDAQVAKWVYMFEKLEKELGQ